MKQPGPIRVRLTVNERDWLVSRLYLDVLWDLGRAGLAKQDEQEVLLRDGPIGLRRKLIAEADLAAAHRLLDKLDWPEGKDRAEALLMYEVGYDLQPERRVT